MTSPKVLRHINQETILTTYRHGNRGWPGKIFKFRWKRNAWKIKFRRISIESSAFSIDLRRKNVFINRETTFVLTVSYMGLNTFIDSFVYSQRRVYREWGPRRK